MGPRFLKRYPFTYTDTFNLLLPKQKNSYRFPKIEKAQKALFQIQTEKFFFGYSFSQIKNGPDSSSLDRLSCRSDRLKSLAYDEKKGPKGSLT